MGKALISLSFDDGRVDNYTVAVPILRRYDLPATFNITTGYVVNRGKNGSPTDIPPMTADMVREICQDNRFEIAGHGYQHRNSYEDITKGIAELKKLLGVDKLTDNGDGFASPGTNLSSEVWTKIHVGGGKLKYARLSLRYLNHQHFKTFCRKASRLTHIPLLYRLAYEDTLMDSVKDDLLYSIPVLSSIKLPELKAVIRYAEKHGKSCVLMLHSIVPKGRVHDNWDFEVGKFEALCAFLKDEQECGKLEVCTSMKVFTHLKDSSNV